MVRIITNYITTLKATRLRVNTRAMSATNKNIHNSVIVILIVQYTPLKKLNGNSVTMFTNLICPSPTGSRPHS